MVLKNNLGLKDMHITIPDGDPLIGGIPATVLAHKSKHFQLLFQSYWLRLVMSTNNADKERIGFLRSLTSMLRCEEKWEALLASPMISTLIEQLISTAKDLTSAKVCLSEVHHFWFVKELGPRMHAWKVNPRTL